MTAERDFCSRRMEEELTLAEEAKTARLRKLHARHADDYGRELSTGSRDRTLEAVAQWKLRRQSEVFGDWLADVM